MKRFLLLALTLCLPGCGQFETVTVGVNYTSPEGRTIGGAVKLNSSFAGQK